MEAIYNLADEFDSIPNIYGLSLI